MARGYDNLQSVSWRDVLKGVEMRFLWHYHAFTYRYEELQELLDRKNPPMEKVLLYARVARGNCEEIFHWESVYVSLRRFLKMRPCMPKKYDMRMVRDYYMKEYKEIDPSSDLLGGFPDDKSIPNAPYSSKK